MSNEFVGRSRTRTQLLDRASLARFTAACGGDPAREEDVPPLAHWAWFLDAAPDRALGPDGHAAHGGLLPTFDDAPRRMFAASRVRFHANLILDAEATEHAVIAAVTEKSGRSGPLCFVEMTREIAQHGTLRIEEHQTLVFRPAGEAELEALPRPAADADAAPENGVLWRPDAVGLFRFSAATFNAHRIHYDLPYTRELEHYPALVVHGPLTAAKLASLAARSGPLREFSFRALAPLFAGQPVRLVHSGDGEVTALRCDGTRAMYASYQTMR